MKNTIILFVLIFFINPLFLCGQNTLELNYNQRKFRLNDETKYKRVGLLGKRIKPMLKEHPLAYIELKKYQKKH